MTNQTRDRCRTLSQVKWVMFNMKSTMWRLKTRNKFRWTLNKFSQLMFFGWWPDCGESCIISHDRTFEKLSDGWWLLCEKCNIKLVTVPAKYVDAVCVVLERRQLSPEHLQSLQDFAVLQVLQVLLLQQQELHTLSNRHETYRKGIHTHIYINSKMNKKDQQRKEKSVKSVWVHPPLLLVNVSIRETKSVCLISGMQ